MSSYPPVPVNGDHSQNTYPFVDPTKVSHDGRYIFITGASKGVGTATAIAFAKAGAAGIALGARSDCSSVEAEILSAAETSGKKAPRILKIKLDVMDYTSVESAAKEIENTFPRLDILINNAAYLSTWLTIADSEPEEYWRNYEINLRGVYWVTKAILPILLREGEKTILNVSSRGAHAIHAGASGYQATKFALLRFTEYLMVENAEQGLLAYCVHPCSVKTVLASGIPEHLQHLLGDKLEIAADTMCFLTAEKRGWLAGRYVDCTWDMPEFLSRKQEIVDADKLRMRMRF